MKYIILAAIAFGSVYLHHLINDPYAKYNKCIEKSIKEWPEYEGTISNDKLNHHFCMHLWPGGDGNPWKGQ